MAQRIREFTTSAFHAIAVRKTWQGPYDIVLAYYDKSHYQPKGHRHMDRCLEKLKKEGHLEILNVDYMENKGVIHGEKEKSHITVCMKAGAAVKCVCHWFMDGKITYEVNGKKSDAMPPDILDKWIEREDAELAAKAGAGEKSGAASK